MDIGPSFVLLLVKDRDDEVVIHSAFRQMNSNAIVLVAHNAQEAYDYMFRKGPFEGQRTQPVVDLMLIDMAVMYFNHQSMIDLIRNHPNAKVQMTTVIAFAAREGSMQELSALRSANGMLKRDDCGDLDLNNIREEVLNVGRYLLGTHNGVLK